MTTLKTSWTFGPGCLEITQGNLTESETDAIVNAANSRLAGGGGVDGAIHAAAGPKLLEACQEIVRKQGMLPPGQAVITPGFNLKARWVIHAVGPIWQGGASSEDKLLASAYSECLDLAKAHGLNSLAFPAISCGAYGYPIELAAVKALETLAKGLIEEKVALAAMCLFSKEAFGTWSKIAEDIFGPAPSNG
ncbi:MAG: macro domain-containing protein [Thermodesulfobacteriota bacterium]|nr:macro domain-containing protein [Thermodesulfobacteriota bacterium]